MADVGKTGPIQRLPIGFLDALNLKNNGQLPRWLPDSIQPTLEMRDWLLAQDKEVVWGQRSFNGAYVGTGNLALSSVPTAPLASAIPEGEIWYCWSSSIQISLSNVVAGDAIEGGFGLIALGASDTVALPLGSRNERAISVLPTFLGAPIQSWGGGDVNRFLRPRASVLCSAGGLRIQVGNSISITAGLEISRLRV